MHSRMSCLISFLPSSLGGNRSEGGNRSQFRPESSVPAPSSASAPAPKFRDGNKDRAPGSKSQGSISSARSKVYLVLQLQRFYHRLRLLICPFFSASSTPHLPVIYPLKFHPTYFEAIDSYFTKLKSSKTLPSSDSPKMDEIFLGLHEYIFENVLLKDESDLKHTDTDKAKRFHHGFLLLVTFLLDPPIFNLSFWTWWKMLMKSLFSLESDFRLTNHRFSLWKFHGWKHHRGMSFALSDFLQEIKSTNVEVRELCFQFMVESARYISVTDLKNLIDILYDMLNLLPYCGDVISFVSNQIPVVQEKLKCLADFLACIVTEHNMHEELKDLMGRVQAVTYEEKHFIFFSVIGVSRAWFHLVYLSDVKKVLNFVQAEELLHSKLRQITELKPQLVLVKEGLLCLRSFFNHFVEIYYEHDEVYGLITSATEMAYKAEYVVDSCLASSYTLSYKAHWISEVVENIKLLIRAVSQNCKIKKADVIQVTEVPLLAHHYQLILQ
ncbi:hypothetical protein P3S68_021613 [Capsicum galapagoense]